jgi:hypothetical protein
MGDRGRDFLLRWLGESQVSGLSSQPFNLLLWEIGGGTFCKGYNTLATDTRAEDLKSTTPFYSKGFKA